MQADGFATAVARLQVSLQPTPPWAWVARALAETLARFEGGGVTDAILLCDLERSWHGGKALHAAADDVVRLAKIEGHVDWGAVLVLEVRSLDVQPQLILASAGGGERATTIPHIPDARLLRLHEEGALAVQRRLKLVGCAVADVGGATQLLPTSLFAVLLDASSAVDRAIVDRATHNPASLRAGMQGGATGDGGAPRMPWLLLSVVEPAPQAEFHQERRLLRVRLRQVLGDEAELHLWEEQTPLAGLLEPGSTLCLRDSLLLTPASDGAAAQLAFDEHATICYLATGPLAAWGVPGLPFSAVQHAAQQQADGVALADVTNGQLAACGAGGPTTAARADVAVLCRMLESPILEGPSGPTNPSPTLSLRVAPFASASADAETCRAEAPARELIVQLTAQSAVSASALHQLASTLRPAHQLLLTGLQPLQLQLQPPPPPPQPGAAAPCAPVALCGVIGAEPRAAALYNLSTSRAALCSSQLHQPQQLATAPPDCVALVCAAAAVAWAPECGGGGLVYGGEPGGGPPELTIALSLRDGGSAEPVQCGSTSSTMEELLDSSAADFGLLPWEEQQRRLNLVLMRQRLWSLTRAGPADAWRIDASVPIDK